MAAADAAAEQSRRAAVRRGLAVGIPTALYGVSLGALAVANGLTVLQACATSLLIFTGGSQFALVGVLGGGGSAIAAIGASSLLGVRNGLYALQVNAMVRPRGLRRLAAAHLTIDESTAVAVAQPTPAGQATGFWTTGITIFIGWNLMTLVGALIGDAIGDPRRYGLDAAAAAAFLALLWPRLNTGTARAVALTGAAVAAGLVPVAPVGVPVIAAAVVAAVAGQRSPRQPG